MPEGEDTSTIGGYEYVRARRKARRTASKAAPGAQPAEAEETVRPKDKLSKISHTSLPNKQDVTCCDCLYEFVHSGNLDDVTCPRCRRKLPLMNYHIDGEWHDAVRTFGSVEVASGATISGVEIRGRDIILAGNAENATVIAFRTLELRDGARFDADRLRFKDLVVRSGSFVFRRDVICRSVDVAGSLEARIVTDATATVRSGGFLGGEIRCRKLIVEDGAGFSARIVTGLGDSSREDTK